MDMKAKTSFPSAYDLKAPVGAEDWRDLYPYYMQFQDNRRPEEDGKFWFCDSQHWPNPFKPFDAVTVEFAVKCLGQYNTRHYLVPPANGVDFRIHNGYVYMSPVSVAQELIPDRVPQFMDRAGHYFTNWSALLDNWMKKVKANIAEMEALTFEALPDVVPVDWVKSGVGLDNTVGLTEAYDRAIQLLYRTWNYHFEFLNLGYAAYLDFFGFMKSQFPTISDQSIAKMVQGVDSDLFRPDDELKKLAKLAVQLGIVAELKAGSVDEMIAKLSGSENGRQWLAAWEAAKDPWFNFTSGNGFYSDDKYWIENLDIPIGYIRDYVARLEAGGEIDRPTAAIAAERDRITEEYRELLDEEARAAFDGKLGLARVVFPYVENHNFYIEHWSMSVFWRKMRELSAIFHQAGFWRNPDDMFYLNRNEVRDAVFDLGMGWGVGVPSTGPTYWPAEIKRRKDILTALQSTPPQPALNTPPEVITEPFTIMLWGITTDAVQKWLNGAGGGSKLEGMAASPGVVEGRARVIRSANDLGLIEEGEILVTPVTAPSWAPVFGKIKATVTDIGGMMSHAAIVCREYGLPAVTGTGTASTAIKTGQMLRVDGTTGEVTILDKVA